MALTQVSTGGVKDGSLLNADINASAAISKSKIENLINNNADNRVITGSGTANTLNAESNVVIDSSGNVGIGQTSPSVKLHVNGGDGLLVERSSGTSIAGFKHSGASAMNVYFQNTGSTNHPYIGSSNQDLTIGTNNIERLRVLSGGGLTFNGDTAAANALDDYEEGTWTPTVTNGATSVTYETNGRQGSYTKIGRFVFFTVIIHMATSTGNGNIILITGLPFTAKSFSHDNAAAGGADPFFQDGFYNANDFSGIVTDGDTRIELVKRSSGAALTGNDVNRGREFRMTGTYMT